MAHIYNGLRQNKYFGKLFQQEIYRNSNDFEKLNMVGEGAFGDVYRVRDKLDNLKIRALKEVDKSIENVMEKLKNEKKIMETVQSPFFTKLYHCYETSEKVYFVMDFHDGGDLHNLIVRYIFDRNWMRFYLAEMVVAVEYLHNNNIAHRDLKPENVMIGRDGHIKITDFGASTFLQTGEKTENEYGSIYYMAPEMIKGLPYDHSVDIYALGATMYMMMYRNAPFASVDKDENKVKQRIINEDVVIPMDRSTKRPGRKLSLLAGLMHKDVKKRFSIDEIKEDQFFRGMSWNKVLQQKYRPPYVPTLADDNDLSHFDQELINIGELESPRKRTRPTKPYNRFEGFGMEEPKENKKNRKRKAGTKLNKSAPLNKKRSN